MRCPGVILDVTSGGGGIHVTTKVSAEEWPLIQPSQVSVAVPPVHTAESKLTPLGRALEPSNNMLLNCTSRICDARQGFIDAGCFSI